MLDFLRQRKRNWVIILFLGVIVVTFALFVGSGSLRDQGAGDVAEINGEIISQREFALQYERALQRYREILKDSLTPEMIKGLNLKANLFEELVQKKLVLQEARRLGIVVTDDELAQHLARVPEFQIGGRFSKSRYLQILEVNRLAPAQFEEEQRDQLTLQRLYSIVLDSVHVTDAEVRERYLVEQEKINLAFVKLSVGDFLAEVKLTDDDIKKYYERNRDSLKEPLRVQVEYLSYPYAQFAPAMQVSNPEIEEYYKANLDSKLRKPKEVKVRYVSMRLAPDADAGQRKAARERADRVVKEARGGKDFAELAKRESDDPSAPKGGDAGWIVQGQTAPDVEKVIFSLAKGAVSDVVETPVGFQIFKVEDIKAERTPSLKEAAAEITRILKNEKAKREAARIADRDREKALSGAEFAALAAESGAKLSETPLISSGQIIPAIGENQEFYKSAFSLTAKELSPLIEGKDAYYILRLKQRREPAVPPLESVRARIEKSVKESKAYELALQKGNNLLDQLKKDKDIGALGQAHHLKVEETGWFSRSAQQIPRIGELSEMRGGPLLVSEQKPIAERLYTQKDALYIFALKARQAADMEQFEKQKDALKKQALAESRQRTLVKFLESLKAKATIKPNLAFLEQS
jgi:peptidyl-prolyl cis-trans isomerase D